VSPTPCFPPLFLPAALTCEQSKTVRVNEKLSPVDGSLTVTAAFPQQDMALLCTIFLDVDTNTYDQKLCEFTLKENTISGTRKLASTVLDLSKYATAETTRTALEVPLPADGSVGTLKFNLVARWLKNFTRADDDGGASIFSGVTDLSSAGTADELGTSAVPATSLAGVQGASSGAGLGGAGQQLEGLKEGVDAEEVQRTHAVRAIEDMWQQHLALDEQRRRSAPLPHPPSAPGGGAGGGDGAGSGMRGDDFTASASAAAARDDLDAALDENASLQAEVRRLQSVLSKAGSGDAVKVRLAERVTELESRLARSERDRADVEERIAMAFTSVIRDLEVELQKTQQELSRVRAAGPGGQLAHSGGAGAYGHAHPSRRTNLFNKKALR